MPHRDKFAIGTMVAPRFKALVGDPQRIYKITYDNIAHLYAPLNGIRRWHVDQLKVNREENDAKPIS